RHSDHPGPPPRRGVHHGAGLASPGSLPRSTNSPVTPRLTGRGRTGRAAVVRCRGTWYHAADAPRPRSRALVMRSVIAVSALVIVVIAALVVGRWWRPGPSPDEPPDGPREHIYIADWGNHRLVRMDDMEGTNWITLGSAGEGLFRFPVSVCVDRAGRVYVAEQRDGRLIRIDDIFG